jgi:hypothetical protein
MKFFDRSAEKAYLAIRSNKKVKITKDITTNERDTMTRQRFWWHELEEPNGLKLFIRILPYDDIPIKSVHGDDEDVIF